MSMQLNRLSALASKISYYRDARDNTGIPATVALALRQIREGKILAEMTAALRAANPANQPALKKELPAVTWSGLFTRRNDQGRQESTGIVCMDLDKMKLAESPNIRDWLKDSPHCLAAFVSPRGVGVKALFLVDNPEDHLSAWESCADHLKACFALDCDPSGKDVCRLCFLAADPGIYISSNCTPLAVTTRARALAVPGNPQSPEEFLKHGPTVLPDITLTNARVPLSVISPDCPRNEWIQVGLALRTQFPDDAEEAKELFTTWSRGDLWKGEPLQGDFFAGEDECAREWDTFIDPTTRQSVVRFRTILAKALDTGKFRMADLAEPGDVQNARFLWLKSQCEKYIQLAGLTADAVKGLRYRDNPNQMIVTTIDGLAKELTDQFRPQVNGTLQIGLIYEILDALFTRSSHARRQELMRGLLGKPGNPLGRIEAEKWLRAVTGTLRETDVAALGHWLWLVKRKQTGLPAEHHHMPILYGAFQGPGKSTAVKRLISPWAELQMQIDVTHFDDDRKARVFMTYAVGVWDEMQGIQKADLSKLKNKITAETTNYRPMQTNDNVDIPMLMNFIGTSNKTVEEMIPDPTGARRFYQIDCADVIPWDEPGGINTIDYPLLWSWVSELEPSPMDNDLRAKLRLKQNRDGFRDSVTRWLAEESWGEYTGPCVVTGMLIALKAVDPAVWVSTAELFQRFAIWCKAAGERVIPRESLGRRLRELKWFPKQSGAADTRGKPGYIAPVKPVMGA